MIKRPFLYALILLITAVFLSGCWDRKELNELGIVMVVGFDKDEQTGKILLTSQVVRPASLGKQSNTGKESPYEIVVTSGVTVFEAIRNTVKEFDRRSFFSHIKVIVVGETLAREGLDDIIDFVSRTHEIRKFTWLVIAKDSSAGEMLGIKHGVEKVQASYIEGIIKRQSVNSDATTSDIIDFIKKMPGEGINPVTGVFKINNVKSIPVEGKEPEERKGIILSGTAVYKKDKLIGFLNEEETLGYNIITGKKKSTAIHVTSPIDDKNRISIEIKEAKSTIVPVMNSDEIFIKINVKAEGNITEVKGDVDISDTDQFEMVNDKFTEFINQTVKTTVDKIQKEIGVDILGFGSEFQRKHPSEWKKYKEKWDTTFPEIPYSLEVDAHLRRTGLLLKPINAKAEKQ